MLGMTIAMTNILIFPARPTTPRRADGAVPEEERRTRSRPTKAPARANTDVFRFPGGAITHQAGGGLGWVCLSLNGELDVLDRHSIVDLPTTCQPGSCVILGPLIAERLKIRERAWSA
jgi:hypothetical protein